MINVDWISNVSDTMWRILPQPKDTGSNVGAEDVSFICNIEVSVNTYFPDFSSLLLIFHLLQ